MRLKRGPQQAEFAVFAAPVADHGADWIAVDAEHPPDEQSRLCRWGAVFAFAARELGRWLAIPGRTFLEPPNHYFRKKLVLKAPEGRAV